MKNSIQHTETSLFRAFSAIKAAEKTFSSPRTIIAAALFFGLCAANVASATDETWNGNTDANWSTAANWSTTTPAAGDDLFFGAAGSSGTTLNNDIAAGTSFLGITFNSGASAYTFTNNSIGLTGGITNSSANAQTISLAIFLGANATLDGGSSGMTLGGAISGSYSLTNAGSGTVTLGSVNNSLTGGVTVNNGTLQVGGSGGNSALGPGDTVVNSGGILVGTTADSFGYKSGHNAPLTIYINGGTVSDTAGAYSITLPNLTFTGGTLTNDPGNTGSGGHTYSFNGDNTTMTINTVASSATATISAPGGIITQRQAVFNVAAGSVTGGATPGVDMLVSAPLLPTSGHHGITKTGNGVLELTGANTFIYGVGINGGLVIAGAAQTGSAGPLGGVGNANDIISFGGGTLQYSSANSYDYSPRFTGTAPQPFSIDLNGQSVTFASALAGSGSSLTLTNSTGSGSLTLSAVNTYSGATAINGGTLIVNGSLASGSAVSVGASGALGGTGTVNGAVTTTGGAEIYAAAAGVAGTLALGGNLNMNSGGSCYLDVSTDHSSGNDLITVGGTLTLNGNTFHINALSGATPLDAGGDYILIQGSSPVSGTVNATPTWDGTPPSNSGNYIVEILGDNVVLHNTTYAGVSIVSASASPSSASRYQSALLSVTVTNGTAPYTVTVDASSIGGSSSLGLVRNASTAGNVYIYTNGVTPSAGTASGIYSLPVTANDSASGTANADISVIVTGASLIWNGDASGNGYWDTAGELEWQGGKTYQDGDFTRFDDTATGVDATNVNLQTTLSPGGIVVSNTAGLPTGIYTFSGNNAITGGTALVKQGSGELAMTEGSDNFSGGILVGGGSLILSNLYGSIAISGGLVVTNGSVLLDQVGTISGGMAISNGASAQLGFGDTYGNLPSGTLTVSGTLTFDRTDDISIGNVIAGGPTGNLVKSNANNVTLTGANTFTGNVTVEGGTLTDTKLGAGDGSSGGLGAVAAGKTITVNSGATLVIPQNVFGGNGVSEANMPSLVINGGTVNDITKYTAIGGVTLNNGATLTVNPGSASGTYQGYQFRGPITVGGSSSSTISTGNGTDNHLDTNTVFNVADVTGDSGADLTVSTGFRNTSGDFGTVPAGLIKTGAGTMLLTANNSYTGNTTVGNGVLALSGSGAISTSPNIIIAGGATFDVSALSPAFALASGQTLSNSTSTAILNGSADASAGTVSLTFASGTPSLTVANGTLTLASGTVFKVNNTGTTLAEGSYKLISAGAGGSVAGTAPSSVTIGGSGVSGTASLQITGGELYLVVTGVTPPTPRITGVSLNGTTLTITATNGADNGTYVLLESTNVAAPFTNWVPVLTNTFDGSGNLNLSTNIINPNNSQQFYILSQ